VSIEIPAPVPASSIDTWSDEVDVLVIGAGMAGVCSALSAVENGARVLVIDRGGPGTSTSAMSGGHFYLGGGTAVQVATGQADSVEEMQKFLAAVSPDADPEKIRLYCEGSVEHFNWIEALGFEFERTYYPHKAVIQPGTEGLMFTGNEKVWPMREKAVPAPRGHKPPRPGDTGGGGVVVELALKRLEERGIEVRFDTGATALVADEAGAVVGATWKHFTDTGSIRAKAVIVAAGGFVMNMEMIEEHAPRLKALFERGMALGNSFDDGLGIRMGESVGGVAEHMDGAFFTSPIYPPGDTLKGIIVNKEGKRFVAEDSYHSRTAAYLFQQPDQIGYLILDSANMAQPAYGFHPLIDGWDTIEDMESALGIPEGNLVETMRRYNSDAASGEDTEFHKYPEWVTPLDEGPWGAYDLTPGKAFYSGFTLGGLKVSVDGEVLRADGTAVPGVYAAGACASNICLDGTGYASGTQLGEASFFGRRAGRHAAEHARP
jgi:succinate dehydrogenase/fumarate reductase flavoprotein subunit